jgi:hypothetical protein
MEISAASALSRGQGAALAEIFAMDGFNFRQAC